MQNKKFDIIKYIEEYSSDWNQIVSNSKNGTFLIHRNYMNYHKERFVDHSLLIFNEKKLIAVFPANEKDSAIYSHGGLTYGGLIYTTKLRTEDVINIIDEITIYYKNKNFKELYYKSIPQIYHTYPSSEDLYALFIKGAELYRRDVSSTICIQNKIKLSKGRKALLSKSKNENIIIEESDDYETFFTKYNVYLNEKYKIRSVHTSKEMEGLKHDFPNDIKLITATKDGDFLGGTILYCTPKVIHAQYIHFSEEGKRIGAFDLMMNKLLEEFKDIEYFDFGISTDNEGKYLNEGLINFKENFGARATICDFYKLVL